jgi:glycosyltransferase involved in cell wall biosynthesis
MIQLLRDDMSPKRILFISNLFPSALFPNMAAYNSQQIAALREHCVVDVISPIPWTALVRRRPASAYRHFDGIGVYHPVYYYPPRYLRTYYGEFFYSSIRNTAERLLARNKYDLVYASWLYPDCWAAAKLAASHHLPLFVKVHGTDVNRLVPGDPVTRRSLEGLAKAEKVICVSKALKKRLIELGASPEKLEVLYNGVDTRIFHPMDRAAVRQQLGVGADESLVLYVGNLKAEKGLGELIHAFRALSGGGRGHMRLAVVGDGPYLPELRRLIDSFGLSDRVRLLGSLPLPTIAQWMNAASVLCLPSYSEGVPNVILEALACGTSVVATSVGGIPELDRGDGRMRLVPARVVEPLTEALRAAVSSEGPQDASGVINSWQQNAAKLMHLFSEYRSERVK